MKSISCPSHPLVHAVGHILCGLKLDLAPVMPEGDAASRTKGQYLSVPGLAIMAKTSKWHAATFDGFNHDLMIDVYTKGHKGEAPPPLGHISADLLEKLPSQIRGQVIINFDFIEANSRWLEHANANHHCLFFHAVTVVDGFDTLDGDGIPEPCPAIQSPCSGLGRSPIGKGYS